MIKDFATHAHSLTNLIKKSVKFYWTLLCQKSYNELKKRLASAPVLKPPNWDQPFHVYCNAFAIAVRTALCQVTKDIGYEHPITYSSRQLTLTKCNYTTTERECLAMIFTFKKNRHYLLAILVVFFIDHMVIKYIVNKAKLSGKLAQWVLLLVIRI